MKKFKLEHWQIISMFLMIYDIVAIIISFFLALWIRFDCRFSLIPSQYFDPYVRFILIDSVFTILVFYKMKLYNSIWRFASYNELIRTTIANMISFVFHCLIITIFYKRMPISYYIFGIGFQFLFTIGIRFSYRLVLLERSKNNSDYNRKEAKNVMLIGAGEAGQMILRDIKKSKETKDKVVCIIDDNPNKWGRFIDGVEVYGGRDSIMEAVEKHKVDKIFLAIPSATLENKRDILNICKETSCELKNLPGMYQIYNGDVSVSQLKNVAIEDLLGRDQISVDLDEICNYIKDKVVLVTGAGGSIGSEISNQVAGHSPKQLILFDIYENSVYDLQQELVRRYPYLNLVVLIGSVRDSRRICNVFETYHPDIVFHAAAHKHVPLMEDSPNESIKNNVAGTYKTAFAAMLYGTKRFVLISTDKAVNPTNIMGASKRLCEMIIQSFDKLIKEKNADKLPVIQEHYDETLINKIKNKEFIPNTEYVAVRFGNVLGSNGSVIPLFKKQIAEGGPVTVTHPDIIRYFMTIPEAVSLVLSAGANASGGEIFVLDMGSPVKIDTLARNLIKLSGLKPDVDIKIEYTGLRPGEKLYEEKLMDEEGLRKTKNKLIHIGSPIPFDTDEFLNNLVELINVSYNNEKDIKLLVAKMVKTYHQA